MCRQDVYEIFEIIMSTTSWPIFLFEIFSEKCFGMKSITNIDILNTIGINLLTHLRLKVIWESVVPIHDTFELN